MSEKVIDFPRYSRWTWIIAILLAIILALLWFTGRGPSAQSGCCVADIAVAPVGDVTAPEVAAEPDSVAVEEPATAITAGAFSAQVATGKVTLSGVVADETTRSKVVDEAKQAFGADNVIDQLTIDGSLGPRAWAAKLGEVFNWQKTVPDAGFQFDNNRLVLTGTVTSDAEKTARGEQAQAYFGSEVIIDNQIQVVAVAAAGSKVECGDRMAVAINFASGSSALNAEAKAMLDQVFECVKDGRFEISGHTDNTGKATSNQTLSLARAEAAKAYLVSKGAKYEDLTASGYGADKPIASNDSEEGKAQNRRIEFSKQ